MKKIHTVLFLAIGFCVVGVWLFTPYIVVVVLGHALPPNEAGPFGDIYGSVNALFTGLALLGVAYTLFAQAHRNALDDAEREKESRRAFLIAQLTALPILIRQEKERIWAIDGEWLVDFVSKDYTPNRLADLRDTAVGRIKILRPAITAAAQALEAGIADDIYGSRGHAVDGHNCMQNELARKEELIPRLERLIELTAQLEKTSSAIVSGELGAPTEQTGDKPKS